MISTSHYLRSLNIEKGNPGGQELLLGEICGVFGGMGCKRVYLPYPTTELVDRLETIGVLSGSVGINQSKVAVDGMYFGTPTIVNDKPLFLPEGLGQGWTKQTERETVRFLVSEAEESSTCRVIVSGLGSGDISPEERMSDMGKGSEIVAYKKFNGFEDWVIVRVLR